MVVDTSAILSVLLKEPEALLFLGKLYRTQSRHISAVNYMESSMVLMSRLGDSTEGTLDRMLQRAGIEIMPVSVDQAKLACEAFRQYGKGRHSAGLNFGDCFSYALAKSTAEPLLFKGQDFSQTDIGIA
jgi:ribonuclease VapC